jgi:hypothetical protein
MEEYKIAFNDLQNQSKQKDNRLSVAELTMTASDGNRRSRPKTLPNRTTIANKHARTSRFFS